MDYFDQYTPLKSLFSARDIQENNRNEFFDFFDSPNAELYDRFFNWTIKNASLHEELVSSPFFLYFFKKEKSDAFATRFNEMNIIGVGTGLLDKIIARCIEKGPELEEAALSLGIDMRKLNDSPAAGFIYLVARHFVYFHEFAHLIQYDPIYNGEVPKPSNVCYGDDKMRQDHVKELDADIFAANLTMSQIQGMFTNYPAEFKTERALEELAAMSLVALFLVFDVLAEGLSRPIYYEEKDHPHHTVRINLLFEMMISKAGRTEGMEGISVLNILPKAAQILTILNEQSIDQFVKTMAFDGGKVKEYQDKYLAEVAKNRWTASSKMDSWFNSRFKR